ncbi:MAG: glycosyltransferase family 4 protein [Gemmataceae bacterium]|nr:glycosyltransferase family 4 protein [Gemmataceae bacterium]
MSHLLLSEVFPPQTGGSGRWFWEVYRRLSRDYVIAAGAHPQQAEFDASHDLRIHRLDLRMKQWGLRSFQGLAGYWRTVRAIKRVVRAEQIQLIHCGRCLPEGVMCLALKCRQRVPYLCYIHGEDVTTAKDSREHAFLVGRVLKNASLLIANSDNTRRILLDEWQMPAERVRTLHPGVDVQFFTPAPPSVEQRERLGWGNRAVVLTVGRLQKRKGQDMMIRALPAIRQAVPNVLYAIAGDGEERQALEQLARELGVTLQVQFLGEVRDSELLACYQQCDLFALPNRAVGQDIEGFGMVLLEAQACGKPVIAGASGGTAETMHIPETGRVVNCDGPDELAALVGDWLRDSGLRERMSRAARAHVAGRFDWSVRSSEAEELFKLAVPSGEPIRPAPQYQGAHDQSAPVLSR